MICGVTIGLAERYGVPATLVRAIFIAAFLATPFAILLYLLLSLSIPSEMSVAGKLRQFPVDMTLSSRERFENFSQLLVNRLLQKRATSWIPAHLLAIWLLILAALLELPRMENTILYLAHPMVPTFLHNLSLLGTSLFFACVAFLLLFQKKRTAPIPILELPKQDTFYCNRGAGKMIGGVVSGIAEVLEIDPAYLRVLLIILNFLTMGLAGAIYLLVWYLHRNKEDVAVISDTELPPRQPDQLSPMFRIGIALLFLLLAGIHLSTEFRFFFFNESFLEGMALSFVGIAFVWHSLATLRSREQLWMVGGSAIFLLGIYQGITNIAHLQISTAKEFEIAEIILALSMVYLGFVVLRGYARSLTFGIAGAFALSSLLIAVGIIPTIYLTELIRFYSFFYPIIFAGFGLWIIFEK
jgi:phage shock protein PspC (stress-responsive transcriptional regulator)